MKLIKFELEGIDNLKDALTVPYERVSFYKGNKGLLQEPDRWINTVTLWQSESSGIQISSKMTDIAYRQEVGSLVFRRVKKQNRDDEVHNFLNSFRASSVEKAIIVDSGFKVDSGIRLCAENHPPLSIVPNSMPFTLAVDFDADAVQYFEPKYSLEYYRFETLN